MLRAQLLLKGEVVALEPIPPAVVQQVGDDTDHARGVEHVHRRAVVRRRDAHGGVLLRGRRAADQQRDAKVAPGHLLGDDHHLVERRGDQPGQPDDVGAQLDRGVEDLLRRHHDAEVVDLVVVAREHDADDVLADVVHVTLHRGEDELAAHAPAPARLLLGLHERLEVGDGALHRARALHDLGQEHLARAEEVADDLHAVHQRAFDDQQGLAVLDARLFRVLLYVFDLAVEDRVLEALLHGALSPRHVDLALRAFSRDRLRKVDEALGGVGPAVEDHVLDHLEQVLRDVLVDDELAGVDDPHVETGADRVVEERGMDRLSDPVVAAEREGEVGDPARDAHARAQALDLPRRLDERLRVLRVLLDAGRDRKDVGVEDDVFGRKPDLVHQQPVGARADGDLALDGVGLADLIEGHDHHGGAILADLSGLLEERPFAAFQADRVADALALQALEPGLEHRPLRAVDHDGKPRDLGFCGEEVQEPHHRGLRVEEVGVHVHVDEVGPAAHLVERDLPRSGEIARLDQPPEPQRAGDVGALADDNETGVGSDLEGLEAAEASSRRPVGQLASRNLRHRFADLADVLRARPAATAGRVQEPRLGELLKQPARGRRLLVVPAERVRQAGVRVTDHIDRRDARHGLDVWPHLGRAERAVDTRGKRLRVLHRGPESLYGLAGQVAAAAVDDGHRDEERDLGRDLLHGRDRRLAVERVEHGLDQQDVDAALLQRPRRLRVAVAKLVERDFAIGRVVDAGREREGHVGRPQGTGHEAVLALVGGLARESRPRQVHLVDVVFEAVVGLGDTRGRESVGRDDVGAGLDVVAVHLRHELRLGEAEHVAVVAQRLGVVAETLAAELSVAEALVLEHHAHRPVEDRDPLLEQQVEALANGCCHRHGDHKDYGSGPWRLAIRPSGLAPSPPSAGTSP